MRDLNDPFVQTYYIIGDYPYMSWGLSSYQKSTILTSMWIIGSIFLIISLISLFITTFIFFKSQLKNLQQIGVPIPDNWIKNDE